MTDKRTRKPKEERVWCPLRGKMLPVAECTDSCVAPEQRPVCWMGKMARDPSDSEATR